MLCSLSVNGLGIPYYINKNIDSKADIMKSGTVERKEVTVSKFYDFFLLSSSLNGISSYCNG